MEDNYIETTCFYVRNIKQLELLKSPILVGCYSPWRKGLSTLTRLRKVIKLNNFIWKQDF